MYYYLIQYDIRLGIPSKANIINAGRNKNDTLLGNEYSSYITIPNIENVTTINCHIIVSKS